jgi:hypothetical protein
MIVRLALTFTIKIGNSFSADSHGTAYNGMIDGIPKDATILRTFSELVYEDGSKATVANGV